MSKLKVITAGAVFLGAAWCGASWYSGKLAEDYYHSNIDMIKANLHGLVKSDFKYEIKLKNEKFSRHFFQSDINYTIEVLAKDAQPIVEVPFKSTLYHGPFPINLIKEFNLMPKMFSVITKIEKTEHTKMIFEMTASETPISSINNVSYSGVINGSLNIDEGEYLFDANYDFVSDLNLPLGKLLFKWKPIQTNYVLNNYDKNNIDNELSIASLDLLVNVINGNAINLSIKNLSRKTNLTRTMQEHVLLGHDIFTTDKASLKFSNDSRPDEQVKYIVLKFDKSNAIAKLNNSKEQPTFIDIALTYDIDNVLVSTSKSKEAYDFGSLKFNAAANHLYSPAVNNLVERLLIQKQALFDERDSFESIKDIVINKPEILINPFTLSNKDGKAKFETKLALKGLSSKIDDEAFLQDLTIAKLFEKFDISTEISKPWLKSITKQIITLINELVKDNMDERTDDIVEAAWGYLKSSGFEETHENNQEKLTSKLFIKNGKLYFNKEEIPPYLQGYFLDKGLMLLPFNIAE